jgi:hypothetical protein
MGDGVVSVRGVPVNAGERVRAAAIAPVWLMCVAGWGVTSGLLLGWSAVRGETRRPTPSVAWEHAA